MISGRLESAARRAPIVAMLAPAVAFCALSAFWSITAASGGGLWPADEVTVPEAVAIRNIAEAVRLIQIGESPYEKRRVREGMLPGSEDPDVSGVEAAIIAANPDLLQVLIEESGVVRADDLAPLRCTMKVRQNPAIDRVLAMYIPTAPACPE